MSEGVSGDSPLDDEVVEDGEVDEVDEDDLVDDDDDAELALDVLMVALDGVWNFLALGSELTPT